MNTKEMDIATVMVMTTAMEKKQRKIQFDGEIIYTEPLGPDQRIVDIITDRVNDAL
jgi:hypothetical protein